MEALVEIKDELLEEVRGLQNRERELEAQVRTAKRCLRTIADGLQPDKKLLMTSTEMRQRAHDCLVKLEGWG
jgi:hypothetical protein